MMLRAPGLQRRAGDDAVRDTNDDAQLSKLSCVRLGYFQDSFVHHFVRRPTRRSPLINRGYYSRYAALRSLLLQFLALGVPGSSAGGGVCPPECSQGAPASAPAATPEAQGGQHDGTPQQPGQQGQQAQLAQLQGHSQQQPEPAAASLPGSQQSTQLPADSGQQAGAGAQQQRQGQQAGRPQRQVLVLGAGYDTTFFQLAAEGVRADKYVELDFPQVTQKKAAAIQQLPDLLACLGGPDVAGSIRPEEGRVVTDSYCLLPADLREPAQLAAALEAAGLDASAPTFVLSECVLVYLRPQHSRDVVGWLAGHLESAAMAVYEQIQPDDAFGQQMMLNLESRGCPLLGIEATPTLEAQQRRFTECGWHRAEAYTMDHVYSRCIDPADRRRIERLEIFDEFEEWHLIQQHYCIALGIKDSTGLFDGFGLPQHAPAPPGPPARLPPSGRGRGAPPPPPRFVM